MPDQTIGIVLTEEDQRRLERLHTHAPHFGLSAIAVIEDVISRKVWDALPKETP